MAHPGVLIPKRWTIRDLLDAIRFPRRKTTLLPSVWVDELMQKRFGTLIICRACARKYQDGIRRWAYVRHPDMKARNLCDFCQQMELYPTSLWFKEEHQYPTREFHERQVSRTRAGFRDLGVLMAPPRTRSPSAARALPCGVDGLQILSGP